MDDKDNPKTGSISNLTNIQPNSSSQASHATSPISIPNLTPKLNEQQEAAELKKALEWELSLDTRDLRSHAWYHGPLSRQRAEEIVQRDGYFLVRDCASQPDNYVLTCHHKSSVLHFVINKIVLQPETVYERIQYRFEEDAFDSVSDLITYYVGSGEAISAASGARIQYPCNRKYPLSFYGYKIIGNQMHSQMLAGIRRASSSPLSSPITNKNISTFFFANSNAAAQHEQQQQQQQLQSKRNPPPRLPSKKQRSQSLTTTAHADVYNGVGGDILQENLGCDNTGGNDESNGEIVAAEEEKRTNETSSNGMMFKRRFSNFDTNSSSGSIESPRTLIDSLNSRNQSRNQLKTNGFLTIARCSAATEVMMMERSNFTTHSLPRCHAAEPSLGGNFSRALSLAPRDLSIGENVSQLLIPEESSTDRAPSPPPKPVRMQAKSKDLLTSTDQQHQLLQRPTKAAPVGANYFGSGSDSGNGSGDSVHSTVPGDANELTLHRGVIIRNPRFMSTSASSATFQNLSEFDAVAAEELLFTLNIPEYKMVSKFDVENFSTLLLPSVDNKPLDGNALGTFKMMILETSPKMIAEHITRIDIQLLINDVLPENDCLDDEMEHLDNCGLVMLTLPQGKTFRNDLIERTQCIKLMVAVTILTCQTEYDRAELLNKWIEIALETKTALGNLFGFCAIMLGLCMTQVQRLDEAWHILRQKFTDSAFTFEAKLRPTLVSMNECSNPQAPNTTVPHVLLYALLRDRPILDIININNASTIEKSSLYLNCITSWESKADDFGMEINFLHLDSARGFLKNLTLYRKNARNVLEESNSRLDELLNDAFRTEFHIKFLWGSKGAAAIAEDRHEKFEKVLTLMTDKFCNAANNNT